MDFRSFCVVIFLLALADHCVTRGTSTTQVSNTNATTVLPTVTQNTTRTAPHSKSIVTIPRLNTTVTAPYANTTVITTPMTPPPSKGCVTKDVCLQETPSPCSCQTSNGMIDLSKVGNVSATDVEFGLTRFYYNPCQKFTMGQCKDALMCENLKLLGYRTVGLPSTTKFAKCAKDIVLMYGYGKKTAEVKLVCDPKLNNATFKMTSERPVITQDYKFELRTRYACPGAAKTTTAKTMTSTVTVNTTVSTTHSKPTVITTPITRPPSKGCVTKDVCSQETPSPCSCRTSNGMIDLSKVGNVSATDVELRLTRFYYNPCHIFTKGQCKDALMCEKLTWPGGFHTVGVPLTTKFAKCAKDMVLMYQYGKKSAEVKLVCDPNLKNATFKMISERPIFTQDYKFELRTRYACPAAVKTTVPPKTTVTTAPTPTTPGNSAASTEVFLAVLLASIIVNVHSIF